MKITRHITALFAALVATAVWAQSAPPPLNLKLPRDAVPAASASVTPAQSTKQDAAAATPVAVTAPDPSAKPTQAQAAVPYYDPDNLPEDSGAPRCNDAAYTQPQVHGGVTMGVVSGNRVSGNYESGVVNASKAFGSCDNPTGGASISIAVGQGNFNRGRQGWH